MKRGRSRSDSPGLTKKDFRIYGYLNLETDSFVSRIFEKTRVVKALSRLKSRKKFWYVFEENSARLLYYKSDSDAKEGREPLGAINIKGSAISLVLEENNQFIIHSEGKEHVLVADNHESMMLWVFALQAKQDVLDDISEIGSDNDHKRPLVSSNSTMENGLTSKSQAASKSKIMRAHSLQLHDKSIISSDDRYQHNPLTRMRSLLNSGHTPDTDFSLLDKGRHTVRSQLPTLTQSMDNGDDEESSQLGKFQDQSPNDSKSCSSSSNTTSSSSTTTTSPTTPTCQPNMDNEFTSDIPSTKPNAEDKPNTTECDDRLSSNSDSENESNSLACRAASEKLRLLKKISAEAIKACDYTQLKDRTSSLSCASASSDSAVGTSECTRSRRIHELESELMSAKCDLAKALNRESSYKSIIEEKINLMTVLEDRLKIMEDIPEELPGTTSPRTGSSPSKSIPTSAGNLIQKLQEKCRILQNHNRFLNEEVRKLSKMIQNEQARNQTKQSQLQRMEKENDQLKRDYVFLLQSSLRITTVDGPETLEVFMYGEDRHKERVLMLLEEAKKTNPTLPSYESLSKSSCHVDPLGFRRQCADEALVLHYICRQLHQHYSTLCPAYDAHQQQWKRYLKQHPTLLRTKELKSLVRGGIPAHLRSKAWALFYKSRIQDLMEDKGSHYYSYLCSLAPDDERVSQHRRQIALDLLRTMPDNIRFSDSNADGVRKMQEVLQAFCLYNPDLGYCQGMNFLVGMLLLFLEPEDAFWCLVAITERYFTANYFDQNLIGAQADQHVLKDLLGERMPGLWRHLARLDIELCTVTLNWFLAVFFDCVPFETLLRIWDCFLLEGPKVLFRFSLAILKLNEKSILLRHDTVSIMRQLKAAAKLCFDVDSLFKTAFEDLKPFTRRQDISAKQACYFKTLKEHAKKIEIEKDSLRDKERMLSEMEILNVSQLVIECAAAYDKDKLWLCHGHQTGAQISKVNCEENIMYRLNIELESRVMCMHALDDDTMLLGTLSHFVHAYSTRARRLMWEVRLNDSVLALCSHEEDGLKQVYAGLADGTIAVIEDVRGCEHKPDTFYIMIGPSPVTCICLVDRKLWCGCGNRVIIISARTLDTVDQFQTSSSMLDYISMLVWEDQGVWITIRGSSVLQLWDSQSLTCKLLFDIKDNRYPKPLRPLDDEANVNQARITAVLPFGGSVLVGTAEGILIIYDIVTRLSRSASTVDFTTRRQLDSNSVDHIQERIQELLLEQKRREETEPSSFESEKSTRSRIDSGFYSNSSRTPQQATSRRESQHVASDHLPAQAEETDHPNVVPESPEDRSETTTVTTIFKIGSDPSGSTPDTPQDDDHLPWTTSVEAVELTTHRAMDTDRDSGRSSSSAQGQIGDALELVANNTKRLCTCHQLASRTMKCRHCLLETSEALRQLFSKYSLGTTQVNHVESSKCHKNVINNSKLLLDEICPALGDSRIKERNNSDGGVELTKGDESEDCSFQTQCNNSVQTEDGIPGTEDTTVKVNGTKPPRTKRNCPKSTKPPLFRAVSADDVTRWVKSQENLSSSIASDSYDFDDVFVAYTEDENDRVSNWLHHPVRAGYYRSKETEALLESIRARALSRRRSSNICDYTIGSSTYSNDQWPSPWCSGKSRSSSPWIDNMSATSVSSCSLGQVRPVFLQQSCLKRSRLTDIRSQLPHWNLVSESEGNETTVKLRCPTIDKSNDTSPNEWLSYEDSITENELGNNRLGVVNKDLLHFSDWSNGTQKGSDTASNISFCSTDVPYTFELNLQEKIKISDKPIKCLLQTRCGGEPTIISCAGCYGDDEAVLKWTKLGDEKLWTNDPIIEVCPYTNAIKPSLYARSRLPRRTTSLASIPTESDFGPRTAVRVVMTNPTSVVNSGLAKVQNMFLRVHDKV